jgi:hypothetical protein
VTATFSGASPIMDYRVSYEHGPSTHCHRIECPVEPTLGCFQHRLVFPSGDSSFGARGAL